MKTRSLVFLLLVLGPRLFAADLTVHAAASLSEALQEIGAAFEKKGADRIEFNFGGSSMLERQIEQGAPGDLFFSADEAKMDALAEKNLLLVDTRRSLLSNTLVLIVGKNARSIPRSASDLTQRAYRKIALAAPETVPAGIYARAYLEMIHLWDALKDKIVPTENVRAALAAVESGNVDAGFVYKTDALISKEIRVAVEIPAAEGPKISYALAVLKSSQAPERAKEFAIYLAGPEARAVFEKFGFRADGSVPQ
ncbi:MAG TPA: molybdate ABC transporter substrate-binding protein [Chthoniobacterales bacterium]|nr:molybdate ABC transporter substrate-binding protein [Chthoniobacterales bacterium]